MSLTQRYDDIFREYGHGIPVAFLRALARHESNFDASDSHGPAWGLLQVVEGVRKDYERRAGVSIPRAQLLDPKTNVAIASDLLSRIVRAYNTSGVPELQTDWNSPEWVKMLVAGYNSGYSRAAGVQYVARCLKQLGLPVTHDSLFLNASKCPKATKNLSNTKKQVWQRQVARTYFSEKALDENAKKKTVLAPSLIPTAAIQKPTPWADKTETTTPSQSSAGGSMWWLLALFILGYKRRK